MRAPTGSITFLHVLRLRLVVARLLGAAVSLGRQEVGEIAPPQRARG